MHIRLFIVTFITTIMFSISCWGNISNLPIQKIGSTNFYVYKVSSKETIYAICKKLNVTKDDILKYNPTVGDGLKSGQTLFFPVNDFTKKPEVKLVEDNTPDMFHHIVERGETLYGISKLYNTTPDAIIVANPSANNGIKTGQVLEIPQIITAIDVTTPSSSQNEIIYHTIKKGDTLFNLSKRYSTTVDKILALNPGVSPTNFKINDVIKISPNTFVEQVIEMPTPEFITYKVKRKDTFYSVAHQFGISVEELTQANKGVEKLKSGMNLYIPKNTVVAEEKIQEAEPSIEKVEEIYDSIHAKNNYDTLKVALILPYMLKSSVNDKQAKLYTEFYRGFLLAVDSVRKEYNNKIVIYTYDSENSMTKIRELISDPKLKEMNMIFAPDDLEQVDILAKFSKDNSINLINIFAIKSESYADNDHFFQVNIPHSYMYAEVVNEYNQLFNDRTPIFFTLEGGTVEDKDIVKELKKSFKDKNIEYKEINFEGSLKDTDIDSIISVADKYIFIPTTSAKSMVSKINITLKRLKNERPEIDFVVFGYPEWITYLQEYKDSFHKWDTYLYSRFFADNTEKGVADITSQYKSWYGKDMMVAAPQFGLLGFDTGMYFLSEACRNNNDFNKSKNVYFGVQNDFKFERVSNWSGFINKSLYIIHFAPDSTTEKIIR